MISKLLGALLALLGGAAALSNLSMIEQMLVESLYALTILILLALLLLILAARLRII